LKIAYEFAVDSINGNFHDKTAIKIKYYSKVILKLQQNLNIGDGLNEEIIKPFEPYIDMERNRHL
jgi:hypothetical protein